MLEQTLSRGRRDLPELEDAGENRSSESSDVGLRWGGGMGRAGLGGRIEAGVVREGVRYEIQVS